MPDSAYARRLRAKCASNRRVARPDYDRKAATAAAGLASWAARENRVDPEGQLPPEARRRKAVADFQADMCQGKLTKLRHRRSKKPTPRSIPSRLSPLS